jgi:hypothetical protein
MVMINGGKELEQMDLKSRQWLQAEYEKATEEERKEKLENLKRWEAEQKESKNDSKNKRTD